MRKAVLKMHVSLDGYVRATSGDVTGWIFRTDDDDRRIAPVQRTDSSALTPLSTCSVALESTLE